MKILGVIPARYASTRFMGKPLIDLGGKSMIQRVYEQAKKAKSLADVVVATDDERIFKHVESFGGKVLMTDEAHQSGTDRCAEVVNQLNAAFIIDELGKKTTSNLLPKPPREGIFDTVVNIQGDEPFILPEQIDAVVAVLNNAPDASFKIATLAKLIDNQAIITDPNVVKVVFAPNGRALYFSRSPIPFLRDTPQYEWHLTGNFYQHLGLYAYRTSALKVIAQLVPSHLEKLERLEQLRWLENGFDIGVGITTHASIGIDTPEDVAKIQHLL